MAVSLDDIEKLAYFIRTNLNEEFDFSSSSGNLLNSIEASVNDFGGIDISIPAEIYDSDYWEKYHIVKKVPGAGSYASQLDDYGKHKGFLDRIIDNSIDCWLQLMSEKYTIINREG